MPNFFIKFIHKVYHSEKNYIYFKCSYESYEKTKSLLSFNFKIKFLNFKEKLIIVNRLILVGNGFDLAHGLKTSYKDFIDDFWENQEIEYFKFKNEYSQYNNDYYTAFNNTYFSFEINPNNNFGKFLNSIKANGLDIQFKNKFLQIISEKINEVNWVDIENEYYNELKKTKNINEVNSDFEEIKNLLENYLLKIEKEISINEKISNNIFLDFHIKDFLSKAINTFSEPIINKCKSLIEFEHSAAFHSFHPNLKYFIRSISKLNQIDANNFIFEHFDKLGGSKKIIEKFQPEKTLFLNFNYTNTTLDYINECNRIKYNNIDNKISEIHIHGELNNSQNPIIFGFGDDVDKKYQEFEDLNDNRYLENFKSIAYLQTDNYKKLLEFIDSEEYQVFIFGHSCGISDRTMLNTIFEHDNCKSIKPFYHLKKDGTDNYTEIVQNISRNFNDKKKYRDRVVNKTYCEPLTQSI